MHENSKLVLLWNKNKMSSDSAFLLFDRLLIRNLYLNLNYEIVLFVAFLIGKKAAETLKIAAGNTNFKRSGQTERLNFVCMGIESKNI